MIAHAVKLVLWTSLVFITLMFLLFMTQMGDCPKKLIDPPVGNARTTQKGLWGLGLLILGAAAWGIESYFILRRRDRV